LGALDVLLFTAEQDLAIRARAAGIDGFVVDWERRDSEARREGDEPGGGPDTAQDLQRVATVEQTQLLCRINAVNDRTAGELDRAIDCGATHVIVPMVESPRDVERVVELNAGRARLGIMIETVAACDAAAAIAQVPVDFVYVGLLDLAIDRHEGNVFRPLVDGTGDRLRECFASTRFGIGGVTAVDCGSPVPCEVLMGELARLRADFVFARRSFKRDMVGRDMSVERRRIAATWQALQQRDATSVARDHDEFARRFGASRPRAASVSRAGSRVSASLTSAPPR
jgi:hypothetical protein